MTRRSKLVTLCLFGVAMLAGCTPAAPGPRSIGAAGGAWEETVRAAQQEGKVVVITRLAPDVRTALGNAFREKYGVDVEFTLGTVPELQPKIVAERATGSYLQDVVHAGSTSLRELKKINGPAPLEPELILPEVADPKAWQGNKLPFQDKELASACSSCALGRP